MRLKEAFVMLFLSAIFSTACATTPREEQRLALAQIKDAIDEYSLPENVNDKYRYEFEITQALNRFLEKYSASALDNEIIDQIAALLTDPTRDIFAARQLGRIGPRAKRTVPALERALERALQYEQSRDWIIGPSVSAIDEICKELPKITLKSVDSNPICKEHMRPQPTGGE